MSHKPTASEVHGAHEEELCTDCVEPEIDCTCEGRLRCSCGVPILTCPCAYGAPEPTETKEREHV